VTELQHGERVWVRAAGAWRRGNAIRFEPQHTANAFVTFKTREGRNTIRVHPRDRTTYPRWTRTHPRSLPDFDGRIEE